MERWLMILQSYQFTVAHKPGSENIADCLSQLICNVTPSQETCTDECVNFLTGACIPKSMSLEQVRVESVNDPVLISLRHCMERRDSKTV